MNDTVDFYETLKILPLEHKYVGGFVTITQDTSVSYFKSLLRSLKESFKIYFKFTVLFFLFSPFLSL